MAIDREKVLQAAQAYVAKKKYDKAIAEYQKIIQQDPDDARTLLKIGDLQSKLEAYAEAVSTYERVGKHYAQQGFALKAIAVYKQIREIVHKHVPHLEDRYGHIVPKLAELYAQLGLVSDALAAYDEVATRLQKAGRDRDAIDVFRKLVELDPTNPLPHLRLAEALSRVKDTDGAIQQFSLATDILVKLGRHDDALKVLERLLHHRGELRFARLAAEMYLARGQANDGMLALAKLQICFQANPKDIETLGLLARAFVVIGQAAKAVEVEKEMARQAQEQGRQELFVEIVAALQAKAPNDPGVQKLATRAEKVRETLASIQVDPESMQGAVPAPSAVSIPDEELVEIEPELEPDPDEQPFPMRPSARPPMQTQGPELAVNDAPLEAPIDEAHEAGDPVLWARQVVADADSFLRLRLWDRALETLRAALEMDPRSTMVRERLRDVLLETGDHEGAIEEMFALAAIALDALDAEGAIEHLLTVLRVVPGHPRAIEMLAELGYEVPAAEPTATFTEPTIQDAQPGYAYPEIPAQPEYRPGYDANAPLPSYDLEEIGPSEAMSPGSYDVRGPDQQPAAAEGFGDEAPLPSFPMDDEAAESHPAAVAATVAASRAFAGGESIEDALEEADFFASRGLFDDARAILEEQLARAPNHPLVVERLRELDSAAAAQSMGGSGTRERPQDGGAPEAVAAAGDDRAFDIAASLDLDSLEELEEPRPEFANADEQVDVEEVFSKFKAGVKASVSESDSSTHYDLGVAYQEMGLYNDAIDEFELAARDPARECVCKHIVGSIHRAQGNLELAIASFQAALGSKQKTTEQELALYYELGDGFEAKGSPSEALAYFERIARRAPAYDDPRGKVSERIAALAPGDRPSRTKAVGNADDFDAAFDAILNGSGTLK